MPTSPEQETALNSFLTSNNLKPAQISQQPQEPQQQSVYGAEKDAQYLAMGKFLANNKLSPVQDEKTLELLTKTDSSTSGQIGSYFAGGANNVVKYLASGAKLIGANDTANSLDQTRKDIEDKYITNKYSGMVGDMVLDPINLAPAGVFTKGAKTAKSIGAGIGLGAGTSIAKDYGNSDVKAEDMATNAAISGALWGGMNGFFASGAYDKLAAPVKKMLFGENYGASAHTGEDVARVTPEQQSVLSSIKSNPEAFGLSPNEASAIPSPLEMKQGADGSYQIAGVGERTIVDESKGTNYQPNWSYGSAEHPIAPYDTTIKPTVNEPQIQQALSFDGERQGLLPNNSQSNTLGYNGVINMPPPQPRPPQTPMEAIDTIVHGKVHTDAPVAPEAMPVPTNTIVNSMLPNEPAVPLAATPEPIVSSVEPAPPAKPASKLKRVGIEDITDQHGGINLQKLNDGEMVAHDNQVWFKKDGKIYSSLDNKPLNYEDLPEYPQIEAYQRHLDSMRGGFATSSMPQNIVAGGTGGAIGATQGDTTEEKLRNALIGAVVGAGGVNALSKVMRSNSLKQSELKLSKYNELKNALSEKERLLQLKAINDASPVTFSQSNDVIAKGIDANGAHIDRPNTLRDNTTPFYGQGAGAVYGIEEDENGEFKFDPQKAMVGAVGGMMGAKIFSSKEKAVEYARKIVGEETTKKWGDATSELKRRFTNTLSANYMAKRDEVVGTINGMSHKLENLHFALNSLDEEARVGIHKALVGEGEAPKGTEELVSSIRKEVDSLSKELVDNGVLSQETFDEWEGFYLHRSYEKDIRKSINDLFKGNFEVGAILNRGKTETMTTAEYAQKLADGTITQEMLGKPLRDGGLRVEQRGSKVEVRRDWTPEERRSMGEVVDASYTVPETLLRMHRMVENAKFLKKVSGMVDDGGVRVVYTPERIAEEFVGKSKEQVSDILDKEGFRKLGDNARYGALSGQWVRKDVASDITKMNDEVYGTFYGKDSPIADIWMKYMRTWKTSKTVWNAPAHINNMVSNLFLMHLSGMSAKDIVVGYAQVGKLLKDGKAYDDIARKKLIGTATEDELKNLSGIEPTIALYKEAQDMGLFGRSQLQDALMGDMNIASKSIYGKATDKVSGWYQMEDVASRITMYKVLREQHGLSARDAKIAVTSIMPDYTKPLPEGWRMLRDSGIAPFISWSYYTLPAIVKALSTKGGATQALKVVAALGALEYATTGLSPLDNIPFLDGKKPEEMKGREIGIIKDGDKITTLKVDKLVPYLGFLDPANYAKGLFSGVTTSLAHDVMTAGSPNGITRLYDNYPVTRKDKSFGDKLLDYGKHFGEGFVPAPQEAYNVINFGVSMMRDEKKRKNSAVMEPKTKEQELLKLLGINTGGYSRSGLYKEQTKK